MYSVREQPSPPIGNAATGPMAASLSTAKRIRRIPNNRPPHEFKIPPGTTEDPYGSASSDDEDPHAVSPAALSISSPSPSYCRICRNKHSDPARVLLVSSILGRKLPHELVLQILELAEYWLCVRVPQARSERFTFQWKDGYFGPLIPHRRDPDAGIITTTTAADGRYKVLPLPSSSPSPSVGMDMSMAGRRWRPRRLEVMFTIWMGMRFVDAYGEGKFGRPEDYWESRRGTPAGWWMTLRSDDRDLGFVSGKAAWPEERGQGRSDGDGAGGDAATTTTGRRRNDECVVARKTWDVVGEEEGREGVGYLRLKEKGGDEFKVKKSELMQVSIYLRNYRYYAGGVYMSMWYGMV